VRPSDILAQHEETRGASGSTCSCREWQTVLIPGGPDIAAWSWATHLIDALDQAGYDIVKRPRAFGAQCGKCGVDFSFTTHQERLDWLAAHEFEHLDYVSFFKVGEP